MESNVWDFNLNGLSTIDAISSIDAGANGINSDQPSFNFMPPLPSGMQASGSTSSQGGLQNPEMQDSLGQLHAFPSMQFSSNHLLVAAKWFHQKKLQRALASSNPHILSGAHVHVDDPVCLRSHGSQEAAKNSLKRLLEGAAGANESLSAGSNGSKTSSPHQISCDSLSSSLVTSMVHPPYLREALSFTTGKEQIEHPSFFFHSRPEFHESLGGSFHSPSAHMNQFQDTMWHSHSQGSCGVLGPPFSCHHGFIQPRDACEGVSGKAKPRVRARRGQATDPHSIAERLRRERIAERIKLLQELVPHTNKTDRAIMLDEIIEYVKFLLIQVKVLSMSRLGGAGLVLPLVASLSEVKSMPAPTEVLGECAGSTQDNMPAIEEHAARLITNNAGAALQFLQRKGLCLMPMSMVESTSKASADASLSQTCLSNQSNSTSITTLADKCRTQT